MAGLHSPVSHTSFQKDINTGSMGQLGGDGRLRANELLQSCGCLCVSRLFTSWFAVCVPESSARLQAAPWVSEPCLCVIGDAPTSWRFLSSTCRIRALPTLCRARAEKPFPDRACVL